MRIALGGLWVFLACISAVGLAEHVLPIRGEKWLREILPFSLGMQPGWLLVFFLTSAIASWWLLRRLK
jgi:hypothetical protein